MQQRIKHDEIYKNINVNYQQQEILDSNCVDTFEKSIQNEILDKSQVKAVGKTMTELKIKQESWLQKL